MSTEPATRLLSWEDVRVLAMGVAEELRAVVAHGRIPGQKLRLYGIPRGGIHAATLVAEALTCLKLDYQLVEDLQEATVLVDDIIDSGTTKARYMKLFDRPGWFVALCERTPDKPEWVSFPWERMRNEAGPEENVARILQYIGENPEREGLRETPSRVVKSWSKLYEGYGKKPEDVIKVFEDGACQEMVVLRDVEFYSTCEHHMLPFSGRAHIGYIPNGRVVGISKLARVLEIFARRLQIQERIGQQVTDAMDRLLMPKGCACLLEAQHLCMTARGVEKQNSIMVTSSMTGCFLDDRAVRDEFLRLVKG